MKQKTGPKLETPPELSPVAWGVLTAPDQGLRVERIPEVQRQSIGGEAFQDHYQKHRAGNCGHL